MQSLLRDSGGHMMDGWNGSWGWMIAMFAMMVAVVWAVVWLSRSFGGSGQSTDQPDETLRRRFASGEITEEEFRRAKDELQRR